MNHQHTSSHIRPSPTLTETSELFGPRPPPSWKKRRSSTTASSSLVSWASKDLPPVPSSPPANPPVDVGSQSTLAASSKSSHLELDKQIGVTEPSVVVEEDAFNLSSMNVSGFFATRRDEQAVTKAEDRILPDEFYSAPAAYPCSSSSSSPPQSKPARSSLRSTPRSSVIGSRPPPEGFTSSKRNSLAHYRRPRTSNCGAPSDVGSVSVAPSTSMYEPPPSIHQYPNQHTSVVQSEIPKPLPPLQQQQQQQVYTQQNLLQQDQQSPSLQQYHRHLQQEQYYQHQQQLQLQQEQYQQQQLQQEQYQQLQQQQFLQQGSVVVHPLERVQTFPTDASVISPPPAGTYYQPDPQIPAPVNQHGHLAYPTNPVAAPPPVEQSQDMTPMKMPMPWEEDAQSPVELSHVSVILNTTQQQLPLPQASIAAIHNTVAEVEMPKAANVKVDSISLSGDALSLSVGATPKVLAESTPSKRMSKSLGHDPQILLQYREGARRTQDPQLQLDYLRIIVNSVKASKEPPNTELWEEADFWADRLIKAGIAEACYIKAVWLEEGSFGKQVDPDGALKLYQAGFKGGHVLSGFHIGKIYESRNKPTHAVEHHRKAAEMGCAEANIRLGFAYLLGELNLAKSETEAVKKFRKATTTVGGVLHAEGAYLYAQLLSNTHPKCHIDAGHRDFKEAVKLLTLAAGEGDHVMAQRDLGRIYEQGIFGCPRSPAESISWYRRAAEQDDAEAQLALSSWCTRGAAGVMERDDRAAFEWCKKAVQKGLPTAEYLFGYYHEQGIGVQQDSAVAKMWYEQAAKNGSHLAKLRLGEEGVGEEKKSCKAQ